MSGSTYIPNPDDASLPISTTSARTAAAEFRALKGKINALTSFLPTWNPADKAAAISLSNGNLLALKTAPADLFTNGVRATVGKNGGESWYFEVLLGTTAGLVSIGVATLLEDMYDSDGTFLGQTAYSVGYQKDGKIYHNGLLAVTVASYTAGDTIGVSFSGSGSVSFYKNNVFQAFILPTLPAYTLYAKYPAIDLTSYGDYVIANFGATPFLYTPPSPSMPLYTPVTYVTGRQNVLINGGMWFDERKARVAQVSPPDFTYISDRWNYRSSVASVYTTTNILADAITTLATKGNVAYLRMLVNTAYATAVAEFIRIHQAIEGVRIARFMYGETAAQQTTLLFYARSSIAGLHSGAITNAAGTRSFPFSFTITLANNWQRIAILVPGCQNGVWVKIAVVAAIVKFNLGAGANLLSTYDGTWKVGDYQGVTGAINLVATLNATLDITGVEWKSGAYPVNSEAEVMDPVVELACCQRYWQRHIINNQGYTGAGFNIGFNIIMPVQMTFNPTTLAFANVNTNCANSTVLVTSPQSVTVTSAGVALGAFIQRCEVFLEAEI